MDYPRYDAQHGAQYKAPYGQNGAQDPGGPYATASYTPQQYNYVDPYAQQPPQIRNPFAPPPTVHSDLTGHNANYDPEYEAQVAQWQSAYSPAGELSEKGRKGKQDNANFAPLGTRNETSSSTAVTSTGVSTPETATGANCPADAFGKTVIRKGGGQTWEDSSLLEWDPTHFRIMVGNLAGEVTDDSLAKAFALYGVSKARVVRDKRSTKSKGYGFVSFYDGEKGFKAAREMVGKYIGSHPVTIKRSTANVTPVTSKSNDKYHNNNKKHNPRKGRNNNQPDPLRANTGAHIEKKPMKNSNGLKLLG